MSNTPHTVILSLGSNLGDRLAWLSQAVDLLEKLPDTTITARSSIYETEPVDVPHEHREKGFLNAVLIIETGLPAEEFSDAIHQIEDLLQRIREIPNQPRTIDIDIITFDDLISDDPELTLPHPRTHQRRFVLQPLSEVNPDFVLPGQKVTVSELLAKLPEAPSVKPCAEQW